MFSPGRLLTVRYEDLSAAPVQATKAMYEFAGLQWAEEIEQKVLDLTAPSNTTFIEHKFDTRRKNSTLTASKWRSKLDYPTAAGLQYRCRPAFSKYGYNEVRDLQDLRNLNKPLTQHTFGKEYLKFERH